MEDRYYVKTMPDGSKWAVPVMVIARDRAASYADEFDGDEERSLYEDTLPLFSADSSEIADWAANNMNWADVKDKAKKLKTSEPVDYQEGWVNGEVEVLKFKDFTTQLGVDYWALAQLAESHWDEYVELSGEDASFARKTFAELKEKAGI